MRGRYNLCSCLLGLSGIYTRIRLGIRINREPKQILDISDILVDRRIRQSSHCGSEFFRDKSAERVYRLDMYLSVGHDSTLFDMCFSGFKLRLEQGNKVNIVISYRLSVVS